MYDDRQKDGAYYELQEIDSLLGFNPIADEVDALIWTEMTKEREQALGGI